MVVESTAVETAAQPAVGRWSQLVVGVVCMVMIANLQYGWTLFVNPIDQKYQWGTAAINWRSVSSLLSKHGWCRSKAGSSTALVRV
jgi:hypothetical protein